MLIPNVEVIWQFLFPKRSHPYCVTSINTNENLMDRDIGKELNQYCSEGLNGMESKISVTKCGYKGSLKAAQRQEWSTVKTKMDFCYLQAIQGHSGGIPIELEMMGYVKIPPNRKKHLHHRGLSWNFQSIVGKGLVPVRKRERQSPSSSLSNTNESFRT